MGGPFHEGPYPQLPLADFGPGRQYRVDVQNGGRTIVVGDPNDSGLQKTSTLVQPGPHAVDIVIHGLPGRFVESLAGTHEITAALLAQLLDAAGVPRGTPLRLITC